jgi:MFS family permease
MFSSYTGISSEAKYLIYQSIFPSIAYGMLFTDISYFLTSIQGLSYGFMGIVISTMGISAFIASIPLGMAADKYGRKKMLIIGNVIAGLTMTAFAFTINPILLIATAVFEGVSEAAFSASSGALLAEKAESTNRNSVFSLYGFAQSIAFGIGSLAIPGVLIFELLGFSSRISHGLLFFTFGLLSLLSIVILLRVHENEKQIKVQDFEGEALKRSRRESRMILAKYVLTGAIIAIGAGMIVPLMTAWLRLQYGIPDTVSGPILGIVSIFIGVATLTGPLLAKRFGLAKSIVLTQALSTVFMFATPLSPTYVIASSVYTIRAFLMNMASPLSQSMIMGLVREDERGMASGVNTALWRLPNALSTYVGAFLMSLGLLAAPFFIATALYAFSIGLFWYYFRKTKMPEEQQIVSPVEPLQ